MKKRIIGLVLILVVSCSFSIFAMQTIDVNNGNDSGEGSLREAVSKIASIDDKIVIQKDLTIILKSEIQLPSVIIEGNDAIVQVEAPGISNFRVFTVPGKSSVTIRNLNIKGGDVSKNENRYDSFGGAIRVNNGENRSLGTGELTLINVMITNSKAINGAAVYNDAKLNIYGGKFSENEINNDNTGGTGSAIFSQGYLKILENDKQGTVISNNKGTAVFFNNQQKETKKKVMIEGATFRNNSSDIAGAMMNNGAVAEISNCQFINNYADSNGGAIAVCPDEDEQDNLIIGKLTINNCTFKGNCNNIESFTEHGTSIGGAIFNLQCYVDIKNSIFGGLNEVDANSSANGGAIGNLGVMNIENSTFIGNSAKKADADDIEPSTGHGGAIMNITVEDGQNTNLTVIGSTFTRNTSEGDGSAINNSELKGMTNTLPTLNLMNSTIGNNLVVKTDKAHDSSYAAIIAGGNANIINCTIVRNKNDFDVTAGLDTCGSKGKLTLCNTVIAGNVNDNGSFDFLIDCSSFDNHGYNVIGSCSEERPHKWESSEGDWLGKSIDDDFLQNGSALSGKLYLASSLVDNGGTTETYAIEKDSIAYSINKNSGSTEWNGCPANDQRGLQRTNLKSRAIGAYDNSGNPGL